MAANEAKIIVVADDKASPTLSGIGEKAKSMRGAFLAVGAAGAAVTGAIALSIKSFAQAGDEIQKMALRTGLTTESLSELKFALEQSGSNIEGFEKGIRRMSSFIQDGRDGLTETTRALDSLGIAVSDFDGMSPEQAFTTLSSALAGVEDDLTQAALAQDIFGRSGTALIPLLAQGTAGIEALKQEAHDLGIVFDQDAADAAARLVDANNTLKKSFQGVQFAIIDGLIPAVSELTEEFGGTISKVSEFAKANETLTKTATISAIAIGGVVTAVAGLGLIIAPLVTGTGALVSFAGLLGTIAAAPITIGISALGAGLAVIGVGMKDIASDVDAANESLHGFDGVLKTLGEQQKYDDILEQIVNIEEVNDRFKVGFEDLATVFQSRAGDISGAGAKMSEAVVLQMASIDASFTNTKSNAIELQRFLNDNGNLIADNAIDQAERISENNKKRWLEEREGWRFHADAVIGELARMADAADKLQREEFAAVLALPSVMRGQTVAGASLAGVSMEGVPFGFFDDFGTAPAPDPLQGHSGVRSNEPIIANVFVTTGSVVAEDLGGVIVKGITDAVNEGVISGEVFT